MVQMGAEKAPKWRPEVTILEARGRREGHGSEKTEIQKRFQNTPEKRPVSIGGLGQKWAMALDEGGGRGLGF